MKRFRGLLVTIAIVGWFTLIVYVFMTPQSKTASQSDQPLSSKVTTKLTKKSTSTYTNEVADMASVAPVVSTAEKADKGPTLKGHKYKVVPGKKATSGQSGTKGTTGSDGRADTADTADTAGTAATAATRVMVK